MGIRQCKGEEQHIVASVGKDVRAGAMRRRWVESVLVITYSMKSWIELDFLQ